MENFDPNVDTHMDELSEILGSALSNKQIHVERLQQAYPDQKVEISEAYNVWKDLESVEVPTFSGDMDAGFYKMLNEAQSTEAPGNVVPLAPNVDGPKGAERKSLIFNLFTPRRMAIAATFILGLAIGKWLDFGNALPNVDNVEQVDSRGEVSFASYEQTPSPYDRIKGINKVKEQENPDLRIIKALNRVILNDPNVNVRLSAIETMVLFSDMPEARTYLIEAIPHQRSSIVQLELADIMIMLEEKGSADEWNELLESDMLEKDAKIHLQESLKTIL